MGMTMRVSTPGNNALTDTNIDHYSIYADSDNVLIKEKTRGTIGVAPNSSSTVSHSLGYVPAIIVFANLSGTQTHVTGSNLSASYPVETYVGTSNLILRSLTNIYGTITFSYYIFYDKLS